VKPLMGLPDIGRSSATLIVAEIGDIGFFRSPKELSSFASAGPGARNPDARVRITRLKKDSNRSVRWLPAGASSLQRSQDHRRKVAAEAGCY